MKDLKTFIHYLPMLTWRIDSLSLYLRTMNILDTAYTDGEVESELVFVL